MKMRIGITQRVLEDAVRGDYDALEQNYVTYFSAFNVDIIPIPNTLPDVIDFVRSTGIERIILSGGGDIDPKLYGGKEIDGAAYVPARDKTEKILMTYAVEKLMPVLGICRGCQFINAFFDGTLRQNSKEPLPGAIEHIRSTHSIAVTGEKMRERAGQKNVSVNSYHNDGFTEKELGNDLKVFATTSDGIIEGYYHERLPILGIMWHPERNESISKFDGELIRLFISGKRASDI